MKINFIIFEQENTNFPNKTYTNFINLYVIK